MSWEPEIIGDYELVDINDLSQESACGCGDSTCVDCLDSEFHRAQALVVEADEEDYPNGEVPSEPDDETIVMTIFQPDRATGELVGVWIGYDQEAE